MAVSNYANFEEIKKILLLTESVTKIFIKLLKSVDSYCYITMWSELPTEILLHIFDYLEPVFLLRTVSKVCVRFKQVLLDDDYTRLNYYQLLYSWCPMVEDVPVLRRNRFNNVADWKNYGCHFRRVWMRWQDPLVYSHRSSVCSVDAVHILKKSKICLVGNREESIDMLDVGGRPEVIGSIPAAHRGWVTALDSYEEHSFVSGGWDSLTKLWQVREHCCQSVWSIDCRRGIMSAVARHDIIAIASFSPILTLVDPRAPQNIHRYNLHIKAIADVAMVGNRVISIARDRALNVFDLRMMDTICRRNRFAGTVKGGLPKCLTAQDNIVYIGDSFGYVHLLDANTDLRAFHSIPVAGPKTSITSIIPDLGTFLCGTSDGVLRVVAPSRPHYVIREMNCRNSASITAMSYDSNILAVGKTNGVLESYVSLARQMT